MQADALRPAIADLMQRERLPESFDAAIDLIYRPLAVAITARRRRADRTLVVGFCGPQGSGKSTGTAVLRLLLEARDFRVAMVSLDDLYLTHAERARLAGAIHPLLVTRGPPGTHDLALGHNLLDQLARDGAVALPAFDKAIDDRRPKAAWARFQGPADVVLFEGWCVGARPEPPEPLALPINRLEAGEDADGTWRAFVNTALARYQPLFARIDYQILLQPPGFEVVARWRREQEAKLRNRTPVDGADLRVMTDAAVDRFVQHYERLTRHIIREMPARADAVVELDPERALRRLHFANGRPA